MRFSSGLARRIDRLARRAHAFHRYAHHPLCAQYSGELIQLSIVRTGSGRSRICRGCSYAAVAALVGTAFGVLTTLPPLWRTAFGALALIGVAGKLVYSRLRSARTIVLGRRASKLWTRGLPAFVIAASLGSLLRAHTLLDLSQAGLLLAGCALLHAGYRRRGPDRTPCTLCPERDRAPCSGFEAIVRAERAFSRRAGQLIDLAARERACPP